MRCDDTKGEEIHSSRLWTISFELALISIFARLRIVSVLDGYSTNELVPSINTASPTPVGTIEPTLKDASAAGVETTMQLMVNSRKRNHKRNNVIESIPAEVVESSGTSKVRT